jgi:hypothetical protein
MNDGRARWLACALCLSLLQTQVARAAKPAFEVRAYANDTCIIADEPFFKPAPLNPDGTPQRFLPLIGLVIGKLAELFINHEIESQADRIKNGAARKDTNYAVTKKMNLYRADFEPVPALVINSKLGCMTIVAAAFKPDGTSCQAEYVPKTLAPESAGLPQSQWKTTRTDDSVENQLRRADVCVDGKIKAVYEARFEFSKDGTAYRLKDAGYRIESLLTTQDKGATRSALYTLKISTPSATQQQDVLSTAWVDIGTITAGSHGSGSKDDSAPWLRVPPLSVEARRIFEDKTKVHQEVAGEIEALKRSLTRNERILTGLDQRIAAASPDLIEGLKQERTRIAVQNQSQSAELDARNAEYQDLPRTPLEFMPVTIEIGVTESESEKKSKLLLADLIKSNSDLVGSALGNDVSGVISRSLKAKGSDTEPGGADSGSEFDRARNRYFDALVAARGQPPGKAAEEAQLNLAAARDKYNEVRRLQGLDPVTSNP